jgi:putative chitinase
MTEAMKKLQDRIGVGADGHFGKNTAKAIAQHFELSNERAAHLMGQASHESGHWRHTRENLNYSADSMMRVWPSRFPDLASCEGYSRNPTALANKVYGGRMGNDANTNDGALFSGRGYLMITGKNNYRAFSSDMGLPEIMTDPDLVAEDYAFDTAMWFFNKNKLFDIADDGVNDETILKICRRVNGGEHGLTDRTTETNKIYEWLNA